MPQTFLPGNKLRLWGNAIRVSQITDDFTLNRMAETHDVTTHEHNGHRAYIAGLRGGGSERAGISDASTARLDEIIAGTLGSTTLTTWTAAIEGDAIGKVAHLWQGAEKQTNISSPANGRIGYSGGDDANGPTLLGRVLRQGTAPVTSTGASTPVVQTASALGGVAHFHLTDALASFGTITAKVQHSSLGVAWSDIATFTSTANGSKHAETTALAVKARVRAIVTALTGSSGHPFLVVAFARKHA